MNLDCKIFDKYRIRETLYRYRQSYDATWCPICDKQVSSKCRDTNELLQHIRQCHPTKSCDNSEYQCSVCYGKLHKSRSGLNSLKNKISWLSHPEIITKNVSRSDRSNKIFSTKVETWRWHSEVLLCPSCNREATPLLFVKQHKFTSSHLGAMCLLGCWPLCFMPLTMSPDKRIRMVCPQCGYDYGTRVDGKCSSLQSCAKELPVTQPTARKCSEIKSTTCFGHPERKLHFEQTPGNVDKWGITERGCSLENNSISSACHTEKHQHQFANSERSECQFCAGRSVPKLQNSEIDGYYDYDCRVSNANCYHDDCNE